METLLTFLYRKDSLAGRTRQTLSITKRESAEKQWCQKVIIYYRGLFAHVPIQFLMPFEVCPRVSSCPYTSGQLKDFPQMLGIISWDKKRRKDRVLPGLWCLAECGIEIVALQKKLGGGGLTLSKSFFLFFAFLASIENRSSTQIKKIKKIRQNSVVSAPQTKKGLPSTYQINTYKQY